MFRNPAPAAAGVIGLGVLVVSLIMGRPDTAVLGLVMVVVCVVGYARTQAPPTSTSAIEGYRDTEERSAEMTVVVSASDADLCVTTIRAGAAETVVTLAAPGGDIAVSVPASRSGEPLALEVLTQAALPESGAFEDVQTGTGVSQRIRPRAKRIARFPLPRRRDRLVGLHESTRGGDGGAFRDVHPFAPGDRLNRIDWRATARLGRAPGDLYVRRTFGVSDIDVALVIDDRDDVGALASDWPTGDPSLDGMTSLGFAREAAWSFAAAALEAGDLVSLQLFSRNRVSVPRGNGIRQRERLAQTIVSIEPQRRALERRRFPHPPAGAIVIVFSTFLSDDVRAACEYWRGSGFRVLGIDTLPLLRAERNDRATRAALALVLGDRDLRIERVRLMGVDMLRWAEGDGARSAALGSIERFARRWR